MTHPSLRRALTALFILIAVARAADERARPDAQFGNWLYKTPDPATWQRAESGGALVFRVDLPPGDFCSITLFPGAPAEPDFTRQFEYALSADQKAKGSLKLEADSGNEPRKADGYDVITRRIQAETAQFHTFHFYLGARAGDRFELAAFQTSTQEMWQTYGAQAAAMLLSLVPANSLPPERVAALLGKANATKPPSLPGFDAPAGAAGAAAPAPRPMTAAKTLPAPAASTATKAAPALRPLETSDIVAKNPAGKLGVAQKNGRPLDGVKLSLHDMEIFSPAIAVAPDGAIHVAFVEKHRSTYALAVYHRASSDGGKTWTEAKNLSEPMPGFSVGSATLLADGAGRVYVIWRTGLREGFGADPSAARGTTHGNLVYRVLEGGKWNAKPLPVHPPGSAQSQDNGSLSWFAAVDPNGRVHVVWNTTPGKFHPELLSPATGSGYRSSLPGVGNGLVFATVLNGTDAGQPREIFLTKIVGEGWNLHCDGLEALKGYVDASGAAHFSASVRDPSVSARNTRIDLFEGGQQKPGIELPGESWQVWSNPPTLLVDAKGRHHIIARYEAGERPGFRDYLVGSDEEPVVIRAAAAVKGRAENFQAYPAPGGRMLVVMQMNDTGEKGDGETFVAIGDGTKWSEPVNVTNNAARKEFWSKRTSSESSISSLKRYYPGPAAAAVDRDGHLVLAMINNEATLVGSMAFGVSLGGGESSTPALTFLRF